MKRFSEQLQKKASTIRLSTAEKRDLEDRVRAYMEYHPLPVLVQEESGAGVPVTTTVTQIHFAGSQVLRWSLATFGLMLVLLTFMAERAVPGDALYAIKVGFTEEVRSTLARTPYEKVVWETERLNRRIAEARLLASEGKLTEAVEAEVAEAVRVHSENARREIEVLKQTDKDGAAMAELQFETVIEVQEASFKHKLAVGDESEENSVSLIQGALTASRQDGDTVSAEMSLPAYDRLMARVEQETTRAQELLTTVKTVATGEEKDDIQRRLEDIDRSIVAAMERSQSDEMAARTDLVLVLQRTQRLIVYLTNIDIRRTVSVEEIVPVTLTIEERNTSLQAGATEILRLVEKANSAMAATTTELALLEKLTPALAEAATIASTTLAGLPYEEVGLSAVEQQLVTALALASDAVVALGETVQVTTEPKVVEELPVEVGTATDTLPVELETEASTTSPVATTSEPVEPEVDEVLPTI